jgi:hypothetical protein
MPRQIEPRSLGLPSWVPNWSSAPDTTFAHFPHDIYSAAKDTKASLRISAETIACTFISDFIRDTVSHVKPDKVLAPTSMEFKQTPIFLQSWTFDVRTSSPAAIPSLQQYFRTLMLVYDLVTEERLTPNEKSFFDLLYGFVAFIRGLRCDLEYSSHLSKLMYLIVRLSREAEIPIDNLPLSLTFLGDQTRRNILLVF